jgi:hypothetical protein
MWQGKGQHRMLGSLQEPHSPFSLGLDEDGSARCRVSHELVCTPARDILQADK